MRPEDSGRDPLGDEAALRTLLTRVGLRATRLRVAILRELWGSPSPPSHLELAALLGTTLLDPTTLYRNLIALTNAGVVVRTRLHDHVWRFGLPRTPAAGASRAHFVCTDCGLVESLSDENVCVSSLSDENVCVSGIEHRVDEIEVRGRCALCAGGAALRSHVRRRA